MAATLDCTIAGGTGGTAFTYALQVESFQVNLRRSPIQVSVTGLNILQDFGVTAPTVTVRGIVPTVTPSPSTDGTNTICTKDQLEDKIISEYGQDYTLALGAGTGAATTSSYLGRIQSVSFTMIPGKESLYWSFNLTLVTANRDVT
tara:strand:- start:913 stop:1350 length:438 start_codon:yes stop_codon:yes gene_type:complete